jgi:hypothetical protein
MHMRIHIFLQHPLINRHLNHLREIKGRRLGDTLTVLQGMLTGESARTHASVCARVRVFSAAVKTGVHACVCMVYEALIDMCNVSVVFACTC